MMLASQTHPVLPASVPTAVIALIAVAAVAAWVGLHLLRWRPGRFWVRALLAALRLCVGFATLLALQQAALRGLVLTTNWPIWTLAAIGAVAVEILVAMYALERRIVSRRVGLTLVASRVLLVLMVVGMLAQPVRSLELRHDIRRYVAVLVDDSASMHLPDTQLSPSEKVRLAERLTPDDVDRPYRLEQTREQIQRARAVLTDQVEWLTALKQTGPDDRKKKAEKGYERLTERLDQARKTLTGALAAVAKPLDDKAKLDARSRGVLMDVKAKLAVAARGRVVEATKLLEDEDSWHQPKRLKRLTGAVRQASTTLAELLPKLAPLSRTLDRLYYNTLAKDKKAKIDAIAKKTRFQLAREVLTRDPSGQDDDDEDDDRPRALLRRLAEDYHVRLYTFAGEPVEQKVPDWLAAGQTRRATSRPAGKQSTNLAAAIEKVMKQLSDDQLAGVVILSDGRHNARRRVEPLVRRLGLKRVPVCSILVGGEKPPTDAAIVALEAPETIYTKDKMYITADLKLDGLAGKTARVTLLDGDRPVDLKNIRVPTDAFRKRIQLADQPTSAGLHAYRVRVQSFDGEAFPTNNEYPLTLSVTNDRTRLLLIDGRPRWEFRYLKNLFADRDHTVKLQYVLFGPDRVAGLEARPKVHASVARGKGQAEATALPANEAEWMKFDVIILGDVPPAMLTQPDLAALKKFVADRGGTLIVIVGREHMPHAFSGTPLAEMLPILFAGADKAVLAGADPSFRIALTDEGAESVILRQKVDPEENLALWNSLPDIYWRYPILNAKAGATVLAFAMPPKVPAFMKPRKHGTPMDEETIERRRRFQRSRALILTHNVAMGRVMTLTFDRTWRLRYRVGDTYHHKFWGQVLRWATANKLPAGTNFVKLGTDRSRYAPNAPVRVRAKIVQANLEPIISPEVAVHLYRGEDLILRKQMRYVPDSPGIYHADLGAIPSGSYRVELVAPAARAVLAADNVKKVATEFSVDPASPTEQIELAVDRALPTRMAELSGGIVTDLARADEVLKALPDSVLVRTERREYTIWSSWPLLIVMMIVATGEWLLRKRVGLA